VISAASMQEAGRPALPAPRGTLSHHVIDALAGDPDTSSLESVPADGADDEQLALFVLQQLSYRRFAGVDPSWEEDPGLVSLRNGLEADMERQLRAEVHVPDVAPADVQEALVRLLDAAEGPSLSRWMADHGTIDHMREFVVHRAAYQLQEADPHSFAIPRLEAGECKTALLELQMDEYGGHEPTEAHAALFADTMRAFGLEPVAHLDRLPAATLATSTLLNRLGRSRRLLPACLGHLAVFEMTSVEPMARYAAAARQLLPGPAGTSAARFYDVHVAADGFHAKLAAERLIQGFVADHPDEATEVLFGAAALMAVEGAFTEHLLRCWDQGRSSLLAPLPGSDLRTPRPSLRRAS
jgi:hypothetical protein